MENTCIFGKHVYFEKHVYLGKHVYFGKPSDIIKSIHYIYKTFCCVSPHKHSNMSEVNTSALKESLEKCFIEQQLALKQLTVQYEDLEDKVELVDCFYTQLDGNQEENRDEIEKLQKRVTELEDHLKKLEDRVEIIDEGNDKRLDLLEERVVVLNSQNNTLRNHLNLTIDMLNNVTRFLNSSNKEQTDEATQVHEVTVSHQNMMNEDTQPTVQQVFAMYQSHLMKRDGMK